MTEILRDCACDPRKPTWSIVAETATPDYLVRDTILSLQNALRGTSPGGRIPDSILEEAITRLALAKALGESEPE